MRRAVRITDLQPGERFSPNSIGGNVYTFLGYDPMSKRVDYSLEEASKKRSDDYIYRDSMVYVIERSGAE